MTYDAAKNSRESYDDAVSEMRWRKECESIPAKRVEHFGPIEAPQGASMYRRFFPDADRQSVQAFVANTEWPRPAAAVQGELLEMAQQQEPETRAAAE